MRGTIAVVILMLVGAGIALGLRSQFQPRVGKVSPVPAGDVELAWIHTTTNAQTWERFVAGVHEAARQLPDMEVDDSAAFLDQTVSVPEVSIGFRDQPNRIRIRWYKISSEVSTREWVAKLAERDPPPLAFIGGGSSDRAIELAKALHDQEEWKGSKPLLCLTTATADWADADLPREGGNENAVKLIDIYPKRSFRFCFTNSAMARAVLDFVWQTPSLRPHGPGGPPAALAHLGALSPWNGIAVAPLLSYETPPQAHILSWMDDPYSADLALRFRELFRPGAGLGLECTAVEVSEIRYSVGTFTSVNPRETGSTELILAEGTPARGRKFLLVLPAATQPARRMIRAFAADSPMIGRSMVAVTGDGISFNTVYRDGEVAWPTRELSIPLVFFAHQNPVAWAEDDPTPITNRTSTDEFLLFADIVRTLGRHIRQPGPITDADELLQRMRKDPFFDTDGERRAGQGEHVVVVRPLIGEDDRVAKDTHFEVYTRSGGKRWELIKLLTK
ncbi:hypothetical protein [Zavarzinella formosa]|uniref:hypothetical protein n=1 Tax=Zavarzinella formosa TaxID=360055 RepID=UPI00030DD2DC|nr:hypothetical protein [Zavarzinella formosa]